MMVPSSWFSLAGASNVLADHGDADSKKRTVPHSIHGELASFAASGIAGSDDDSSSGKLGLGGIPVATLVAPSLLDLNE